MADIRLFSIAQCFKACVLCFVISFGSCVSMDSACIEVKKAYGEKGFDENEVPNTAVPGADLSICPQQESCCTRSMEEKLLSLSRKEHDQEIYKAFKIMKSTFASKTRKFDDFFTELLDNARDDLHDMFSKTYGLLYKQNAHIFKKLFDDLREYYTGRTRNVDLVDVMDAFFTRLFQRMFELMNPSHKFDQEYLNCITERMIDLKPAKDVPEKLKKQVRRAFIAARTFVQGLAVGRDVVTTVMEIQPTEACIRAVVKMRYCPSCRSLTNTKPCNNYCLNTMKGCLAYHSELNAAWNEYISALHQLADRLEGPFNIETVVDPINVKISEAIMNVQESNERIKSSIFNSCGSAPISRKRREAAPEPKNGQASYERQPDTYDKQRVMFDYTSGGKSSFNMKPGKSRQDTTLDRLVRDIKEKVIPAKDFWVRIPYNVCNNEELAAPPSTEEDCWNGQDRAKYIPEVQKDGLLQQINNPEVEVDVAKINSIVTRQKLQLQMVTERLQDAYNGDDVEWIDTEIDGMGSGSGSGDYSIIEETGSGSGDGGRPGHDDDDFTYDNDDDEDKDRYTDRNNWGNRGNNNRNNNKNGGRGKGNNKNWNNRGNNSGGDKHRGGGSQGSNPGLPDREQDSDRSGGAGREGVGEGRTGDNSGSKGDDGNAASCVVVSSWLGFVLLVISLLHSRPLRLVGGCRWC